MSVEGLNTAERAVLDAVARSGPDGILISALRHQLTTNGTHDKDDVTAGLRMLMSSQKITVNRTASGTDHVITLRRAQVSENFNVVLGVVKAAGSNGVDVQGIMIRTKVPKAEITKALNTFVQQQTVRETRCYTNKAKKLYIFAEYEPSSDVTGGTFYTENRDLDTALIDLARQRITTHIVNNGSASVRHLKAVLEQDTRIAQRRLTMKEVGTVARSLQLDGVLKRARHVASAVDVAERTYMLSVSNPDLSALGAKSNRLGEADTWAATFPCTSCPQLNVCQRHGVITPLNCAYLRDWMSVATPSDSSAAASPGSVVKTEAHDDMAPPAPRRGPKAEGDAPPLF